MSPGAAMGLMDAVPMPLVLIGADERVIAANGRAVAMFGPGMPERHYITVLRQPVLLDCVEAALAGGQAAEARFASRDAARDVTYQVRAEPCRFADAGAVMLSLEDVSHVEEAGQMRRDFVANVSHELRTPLTALLGFIETLGGPAKDDPVARERFLGIMAREAERMSRLIQDLLSLSRVEADERIRPSADVDLAAILQQVVASLGPLAEERRVKIALEGLEQECRVPGDADQLLQVFTNLIENAVKYGGAQVRVSLTRQAEDRVLRAASVRVVVADDGEGIDALHLPRLTERFYRVDSHRSREMGGTGLGLAIVKHIVNRHRGRLRVQSEIGKGSRFSVVLPSGL